MHGNRQSGGARRGLLLNGLHVNGHSFIGGVTQIQLELCRPVTIRLKGKNVTPSPHPAKIEFTGLLGGCLLHRIAAAIAQTDDHMLDGLVAPFREHNSADSYAIVYELGHSFNGYEKYQD